MSNAGKSASKPVLAAIGVVLAMSFGAAHAQFLEASSEEPLDITSDRLESEEDVATWTGDVQVVQGPAVLTTDKLVITQSEDGGINEIRAIGNVRYSNGEETIAGEQALYIETDRTLTMTGDVIVTQGKQIMRGGELTYWVDTGKIRFTAPEGRRVRGIFYTKSLEGQS